MATAGDRPRAGREIGREEEGSPALVLPHMSTFVHTRAPERFGVTSDHDMAQRECGRTASQGSQVGQRPGDRRAMGFDDAVHHGHADPAGCED